LLSYFPSESEGEREGIALKKKILLHDVANDIHYMYTAERLDLSSRINKIKINKVNRRWNILFKEHLLANTIYK